MTAKWHHALQVEHETVTAHHPYNGTPLYWIYVLLYRTHKQTELIERLEERVAELERDKYGGAE